MTTPKASGRACITHHHACDCREARVAKLVEALESIAEYGTHTKSWHDVDLLASVVSRVSRAALDEWRKG